MTTAANDDGRRALTMRRWGRGLIITLFSLLLVIYVAGPVACPRQ